MGLKGGSEHSSTLHCPRNHPLFVTGAGRSDDAGRHNSGMTQTIEDLHVYLRSVRPDERTSLSVLASMVPQGAKVLDLGCGSGALGQYLAQTRQCTSDGVTLSEAEAAHARPHYRRVEVADLEAADLVQMFAGQRYDAIICADVLEHLKRPELVLAACRKMLATDGKLLISVPNAGYSGLIAELLHGEFLYREEGLLDRTHLRFFTRRSLLRFLADQRWHVDSLETVERALPESEFRIAFDHMPPAVARHLLASPDALTYQFIGCAHPVAQTESPATFPADDWPGDALFTTQLYLGQAHGYDEERKLTRTGAMGRERQTLRFALPQAPLTQLRLDPADRPGFVHLYRMALCRADGTACWQWQAADTSQPPLSATGHQQIAWQPLLPGVADAMLLLLTGDDPWFTVPIPEALLQECCLVGELTFEVELGWPLSADYLALAQTVRPLQEQVRQLHATQDQFVEQLQASRAELDCAHTQQHALGSALSGSQAENAELRRHRHELTQAHARLVGEHTQLAAYLRSIENSTVFRATRPLVHAKMRLDRLLGRRPPQAAAAPVAQPLPAPAHPVDVIVPVYKGLADTRLCIDSVLAAPVRCDYRLIVINDCSPEPEVTQWLRERAAQDTRITLLENAENLGFVGTVNRGMALSEANDVLLLNSDTEVANDWLDRIRAAAYGDQRIASVTPLSTNATICSYPRFCEDNPLPPGYDTQRLDALCAATNPGVAVDVPTGVGFCMYIRRDSLQQVGLFDTEHFGKGYGEENDFCQRAARAGWRNLHLLDTFVLHTGGVSFGESKSPRERAAMETLAKLHPNYARDVHAFVQTDPARPYRLALDIARLGQASTPTILAVLHNRGGGTERHVRELAAHLEGQAQFLMLTPARGDSVKLTMASAAEGFELTFRLGDQWGELVQVLQALGVCHVHYHHLLGHGEQVRELPALLGVAYDFTAHDFYSYCTHISLTGSTGRYVASEVAGQCACCASNMPAPLFGTVEQWRHANARWLTAARFVLAPSHDTAQRIAAFAPAARVLVVPHTDMAQSLAPETTSAPRPMDPQRPLKIAVIGALSVIKGADTLEAVALEAAKQGAPVEFHLLGYGYRHLQGQPKARLSVHGAYQEEDLPGLLDWLQPDVVWFPALWPETYSYTLSAALRAGLPVAVPDIGAFAERVENRPWSWICAWDQSGKAWLEFFLQLRANHFIPGTPPAIPEPLAPAPVQAPWHYANEYREGLAARRADTTALTAPALAHWRPEPTAGEASRSAALQALVYLRSLPGLRGVARLVPAHWQRKVKNWLSA
jgi:GT2 family glycosyltransferase/2-polyprenyl-3-methyl-5-hydroxy-6-metoxy-1,4-benzoquinol methylase/glycosyltransferase involved in cell wall biosynthesis